MSDLYQQHEIFTQGKYNLLTSELILESGLDPVQIGQEVNGMILPFTRGYADPPLMVSYPVEEIISSILAGNSVIAVEQNKVIGHSRFKVHPGNTQEGKLLLEVGSVVVDQAYTGNGLSKALIVSTVETARSRLDQMGLNGQIISVVGNINAGSIRSFESLGRHFKGIRKLESWEFPSNLQFLIPETGKVIFDLTNM